MLSVTETGSEPITTAIAKEWLKIEASFTDDDTMIDRIVKAARHQAERFTRIALRPKTVVETFDQFPEGVGVLRLHFFPLVAVSSVQYNDSDSVQQTVSSGDYKTDTKDRPPRVIPTEVWPSTDEYANAVTVNYTCGYSTLADIPGDIVIAMKYIIAKMYENREDFPERFRNSSENLLRQYRIKDYYFRNA